MKLCFLAGLPRSGSTLLTSILYQNPIIHTEGDSSLAGLMWNAHEALNVETTFSAGKDQIAKDILDSLPKLYYANTNRPIVLDKSRAWTTEPMVGLLNTYFVKPKVIVCVRKIEDVVKSFEMLFERNERYDFVGSNFEYGLQLAISGVNFAKSCNNPDMFHFVDYDNFVDNTDNELEKIYRFLGIDFYEHRLNDIHNENGWDDSVYGLATMHDVRKTICRRK